MYCLCSDLHEISSHFHSIANLLARVVRPDPGLPITTKHVGLECKNLSSVYNRKKINNDFRKYIHSNI